MKITHNGREINISFDNCSYDHDYWCDMYICNAHYVDSGEEVSDEVYDELNDNINKDTWIQNYLY